MRKLQKGGSSSGLLGWVWRTNYILFERDTSRDETGPKMVCAENEEKLTKYFKLKKKEKESLIFCTNIIFFKIITKAKL